MTYTNGTSRTGRPWQRLKGRVLKVSKVCHLCGKTGADTADHIVPVSLGGQVYDPDNLAPAHQECNRIRGNRPIGAVRAELMYGLDYEPGWLPDGSGYMNADGTVSSRQW